jgi:hypothetical protein
LVTLGAALANENLDMIVSKPVPNPLEHYVQSMTFEHLPVFDRINTGGVKYALNLLKLSNKMKTELIENLVFEKYGKAAYRIWRLLAEKKMLDDKQISKLALVDEKLARSNLYSMLKSGLVFVQVSLNLI